MTAKISWIIIKVELEDMEPIRATTEESVFGGQADNSMIRPTTAEVHVTNGAVTSVTIRGDILTKTGAVSKRHTYQGMVIGHVKLETEIGSTALAQLRNTL